MLLKIFFICYIVLISEQAVSLDYSYENGFPVTEKPLKNLVINEVAKLVPKGQMTIFQEIFNKADPNKRILVEIHAEVDTSAPYISRNGFHYFQQRDDFPEFVTKVTITVLCVLCVFGIVTAVVRTCLRRCLVRRELKIPATRQKKTLGNNFNQYNPDYNKVWLEYPNNYPDQPKMNLKSLPHPCSKNQNYISCIKRVLGNSARVHLKAPFYENTRDTLSLIANPSLLQSMDTPAMKQPVDKMKLVTGCEIPTCGLWISKSNGSVITCPKVPFPGNSFIEDLEDVEIIVVDQNNPFHGQSVEEITDGTEISTMESSFQGQIVKDHANVKVMFQKNLPSHKDASPEGSKYLPYSFYISQNNEKLSPSDECNVDILEQDFEDVIMRDGILQEIKEGSENVMSSQQKIFSDKAIKIDSGKGFDQSAMEASECTKNLVDHYKKCNMACPNVPLRGQSMNDDPGNFQHIPFCSHFLKGNANEPDHRNNEKVLAFKEENKNEKGGNVKNFNEF